jgi:CRISPR-associated protein Cas1
VVTLYGYGINIRLERGHLRVDDGMAPDSRHFRFPRVGHNLRRLVVIGNDGCVSLAALTWLSDQNISFAMLDRDGSVLLTTGPVRPSDARLRRAQALAHTSDMALTIARYLIDQKLVAQEQVARAKLNAPAIGDEIAQWRLALTKAESIPNIRFIESQAAYEYWSAFRSVAVQFPKRDLHRVPEHWRTFGTRQSPITKSPRLAINPTNAILNYLYTVLESETRIAAASLGLDPGLGFLHMDTIARDSLACDLMEPIRAKIDAFVLDLICGQTLNRDWFFELGNGNCRLMPAITTALSDTALKWSQLVAPIAEWVARQLWTSVRGKAARKNSPPTHLTQTHRALVKGAVPRAPADPTPMVQRVCEKCGKPVTHKSRRCGKCARDLFRNEMLTIANQGRVLANTPEANAKRVEKQAKQWAARRAWKPEAQPDWLTKEFFRSEVAPRLATVSVPKIAAALSVSDAYAADIRAGRHNPHPRHWMALAKLVGP